MSLEAFQASFLLASSADTLGFHYQKTSSAKILEDIKSYGGLRGVTVQPPKWKASEGTVLHIASALALSTEKTGDTLLNEFAVQYVAGMDAMDDRIPGTVLLDWTGKLRPREIYGYRLPFDSHAKDNCAAIRAMCIGLVFVKPHYLPKLISVAIESGRITHHNPSAYLGALTAALFTSYAVRGIEPREWGARLIAVLPKALEYVIGTGHFVDENKNAWSEFEQKWTEYLKVRQITDGESKPKFPKKYGLKERVILFQNFAGTKVPGAHGYDATIIAYDAILSSGNSWEDLCKNAVFHGGAGHASGSLAAAWWGAIYGLSLVPKTNYESIEYYDCLIGLGSKLYELSW
ncbi:protein ADP-ribosylarginine hydrolase-like [Anneissia japonica]|uniref:protein ADP-ribosylarginine hydrolase-like n=1 Tax=Anneissia japonica TaxID=1529436 RepID=UPI0014258216|nr:protein ADP-ribosylarginine hydrolase-like [Anneissia japonica]